MCLSHKRNRFPISLNFASRKPAFRFIFQRRSSPHPPPYISRLWVVFASVKFLKRKAHFPLLCFAKSSYNDTAAGCSTDRDIHKWKVALAGGDPFIRSIFQCEFIRRKKRCDSRFVSLYSRAVSGRNTFSNFRISFSWRRKRIKCPVHLKKNISFVSVVACALLVNNYSFY